MHVHREINRFRTARENLSSPIPFRFTKSPLAADKKGQTIIFYGDPNPQSFLPPERKKKGDFGGYTFTTDALKAQSPFLQRIYSFAQRRKMGLQSRLLLFFTLSLKYSYTWRRGRASPRWPSRSSWGSRPCRWSWVRCPTAWACNGSGCWSPRGCPGSGSGYKRR